MINFNTFTNYFFYLFICYHYAKYKYPDKTQEYMITVSYHCIYFYSKLQIILNKLHNTLIQNEKYCQLLSTFKSMNSDIDAIKDHILSYVSNNFGLELTPDAPKPRNSVTVDIVADNNIEVTFDKDDFLDHYLSIFVAKHEKTDTVCECSKNETLENTQDDSGEYANDDFMEVAKEDVKEHEKPGEKDDAPKYDFIIINGEDNLKKIVKNDDLTDISCVFVMEPFLYKPILCEFLDNENNVIKIDFCDNNKMYDYLLVGNCIDKTFLTFFMKKYYDIDIKDNYVLKILDNNVNTIQFESCDIMKLETNGIVKLTA